MKKVLIVITTEFFSFGGLTSVMMNYYRKLNRYDIQIDFASTNVPPETDDSFKYIKSNGSNYYCLGRRKRNTISYLSNLRRLLKDNHYDVIHVNGNSSTMVLELFTARISGVKTRISHGHTTKSEHPLVQKILKRLLLKISTHRIAVSDAAGKWLYGDGYVVLNNAINVEKYKYNPQIRRKLRSEFGLENSFVIGNVGKLYSPKNQMFLIDVHTYLIRLIPSVKLIFVGGGELEQELEKYAAHLGLSDSIIFLGMRDDVSDVLQIFDLFVFPSIYEGLGLALIEAQASGLKCVASNVVPAETKVTDSVYYFGLDESAEKWAERISSIDVGDRKVLSEQASVSIKEHGFDISLEAHKLEEIYNL